MHKRKWFFFLLLRIKPTRLFRKTLKILFLFSASSSSSEPSSSCLCGKQAQGKYFKKELNKRQKVTITFSCMHPTSPSPPCRKEFLPRSQRANTNMLWVPENCSPRLGLFQPSLFRIGMGIVPLDAPAVQRVVGRWGHSNLLTDF